MAALVGGTLAVVAGLARVTGFPGDYNAAQPSSAEWLATRSGRWAVWRDVATRDLVVFVPGYVVVGTAALVWAVPRRVLRVAAVASLLAAGAADVVETLLFRGTLDRFRERGHRRRAGDPHDGDGRLHGGEEGRDRAGLPRTGGPHPRPAGGPGRVSHRSKRATVSTWNVCGKASTRARKSSR